MLQSHKSIKAYIPPENICVGALHCDRPARLDFGITHTNMLVSKMPFGPNTNYHRPNANNHGGPNVKGWNNHSGWPDSGSCWAFQIHFVSLILLPLATPHEHGF